jgi:anti-anti-sigma factor
LSFARRAARTRPPIGVLVEAHARAQADGISLTVANPQPIVRRVLDVTGLLSSLTRER